MFDVILNPALQKFDNFANDAMNNPRGAQKSKIIRLQVTRTDGTINAVKATNDSCYRISRPQPEQSQNNVARMGFFKAIAAQFGGADRIPPSVQEAMARADFGGNVRFEAGAESNAANFNTGKPLRAYRIQQVLKAVRKELGISEDGAKNLLNRLPKVIGLPEDAPERVSMKTALENLFKAALPPKWNRSRHINANALSDYFMADNIGELQTKLSEVIVPRILSNLDAWEKADRAANEIKEVLGHLQDLFENPAKQSHVHQIWNIFDDILNPAALHNLEIGKEIDTEGNFKYDLSGETIAELEGAALARQLETTGDVASFKSGILDLLSSRYAASDSTETAYQGVIEQIANIGLDLSGNASIQDVVAKLESGLVAIRDGEGLKSLEAPGTRNGCADLLKGVCKELEKVKTRLNEAEEYEFAEENEGFVEEDEVPETWDDDGVRGDQQSGNTTKRTATTKPATESLIPNEEEEIDTRTNRTNRQNGANGQLTAVDIDNAKFNAGRCALNVYGFLAAVNIEKKNPVMINPQTNDPVPSLIEENKGKVQEELENFAKELIGKGGNRLIEADNLDARDQKLIKDLKEACSDITEYPLALKLMRQYCDGIADAKQKFLCRVKIDAFKAEFDKKFADDVKNLDYITIDDYVETLGREYGVLERTPKALAQFLTEKLSKVFPSFAYNSTGDLPTRLPEIAKNILAGGAARDQALAELQERFEARLAWDKKEGVDMPLDQATARTVFTGICGILKTGLSPAQQAFVKAEIKEYRDWYNGVKDAKGKHVTPTNEQIAKWKFSKAVDKAYQEKVFRLFGNQLNPITADTEGPTTANTCRKGDILPLGKGDKKSLPGLTKNIPGVGGFQIAADATYFGGTWGNLGQEEGLLKDLPAFVIALLARQDYIEPVHRESGKVVTDGDAEKVTAWRYKCDANNERKLKSWLGFALPAFTFSTGGKPIDGDDVKLTYYVFTAASGFGRGKANIDRGGFLEALRRRPQAKLRTDDDRKRADAFFDRLDALHGRIKSRKNSKGESETYFDDEEIQFLYTTKSSFGYGARTGKYLLNDIMFLAHFYVGKDFNVFGENADDEFNKLMNLVKGGNYQNHLEIAKKNYEATVKYQTGLWTKMFGKLNLDYVVCTTPGGTWFANPEETMIKHLTRGIARFGGNIQYYLHHFSETSPVKTYSTMFKNAARSIRRKLKNVIQG